MNKLIFLLILLFTQSIATAQSSTFTATKVGTTDQLTTEADTISFSPYKETHPGTSERFVSIHGSEYKFIHRKAKGGLKEVFDSLGNKIASIPLAGPNRLSILLANGATLKFQATGKESWTYTKNGKDAISGYHYVWENKKYYVIHRDDSTITNSVVPAIFLEYGLGDTHRYHNSKRTGAIIATVGVSAMLALIKVATEDDDDF
jgi:hypothetical protein